MSSARIIRIFGCGDCPKAEEEAKAQLVSTKAKASFLKMLRLLVFICFRLSLIPLGCRFEIAEIVRQIAEILALVFQRSAQNVDHAVGNGTF